MRVVGRAVEGVDDEPFVAGTGDRRRLLPLGSPRPGTRRARPRRWRPHWPGRLRSPDRAAFSRSHREDRRTARVSSSAARWARSITKSSGSTLLLFGTRRLMFRRAYRTRLDRILAAVEIPAIGLWLGALCGFAFIFAPAAFHAGPRRHAIRKPDHRQPARSRRRRRRLRRHRNRRRARALVRCRRSHQRHRPRGAHRGGVAPGGLRNVRDRAGDGHDRRRPLGGICRPAPALDGGVRRRRRSARWRPWSWPPFARTHRPRHGVPRRVPLGDDRPAGGPRQRRPPARRRPRVRFRGRAPRRYVSEDRRAGHQEQAAAGISRRSTPSSTSTATATSS